MKLRVITNSERGTFACPRRWGWRYLDGLTTGDAAAPLRQGDLVHQCLAEYYRRNCDMTLDHVVGAVIEPWIEKQTAWALENTSSDAAEQRISENEDIAAQTLAMVEDYLKTYDRDAERYEILAVEAQIARRLEGVVDMPTMPNGKRRKRQWVYGGAVDLVVRDRSTGHALIMEHKTTAETDLESYCGKLDWDPQIRGYSWGLAQPIAGLATIDEPLDIRGVLYNVLRKKRPSIPKLKKDGTTSKAKCDTTYDVFLSTLLERGEDPDDFRDILESLRHREFFRRELYPMPDIEKERFGHELMYSATALKEASRPNAYLHRQFSVCTGHRGTKCEYRHICLDYDGDWRGHGFRKMTIRHRELEGDLCNPCSDERGITIGSEGELGKVKESQEDENERKKVDLARAFQQQCNDVEDDFFDGF